MSQWRPITLLWIFLSFLILGTPFFVFAQGESAHALYKEGLRLREAGEIVEAEAYLRKALQLEPGNAGYHFELANFYAIRSDAWSDDPTHPNAIAVLDLAAYHLDQAITLEPDFMQAYYNLGVVYKRQGQYEKAREEFKEVLEIDEKSAHARMQIGATYEEQGFFDEAGDQYRMAREYDYHNPDIRAAIEDLEIRKEEARRQALEEAYMDQMVSRGYDFHYSPGSHASQVEDDRRAGYGSQRGVQQAIPYLAQMIMQQLMKRGDK